MGKSLKQNDDALPVPPCHLTMDYDANELHSGLNDTGDEPADISDSEIEASGTLQESINSNMPKHLSFYLGRMKRTESSSSAKKVKWAVGSYNTWRDAHAQSHGGEKPPSVDDFLSMSNSEICSVLVKFVNGGRKLGGELYPPKSMCQLLYSLMKQVYMQGRNVPLWSSEEFVPLYVALENNVKDSIREGIGQTKDPDVITPEQIEHLWINGHLGDSIPEQLLDTLFWLITWHFGIFAGTEHRALSISCFKFGEADGLKFVELSNNEIKCRVKTKVFEDKTNPARCLYRVLTKYLHLVDHAWIENALYLHPNHFKKGKSERTWFRQQPLGQHQLAQRVKKIMNNGGFEGFYKNISLYRAFQKSSDKD